MNDFSGNRTYNHCISKSHTKELRRATYILADLDYLTYYINLMYSNF